MRISKYTFLCLAYLLVILFSCNSDVPKEQSATVLPQELTKESINSDLQSDEVDARLNEEPPPPSQLPTMDSTVLEKNGDENGTAIATSTRSATTIPKAKEVANKIPTKKRSEKKGKKEKAVAGVKFDSQTYPYGNIRQGDIVEHQFYFTNTGNAPLIITNVNASCGCTQPSYPFIPIEPGEKGYIGVTFDSKGKLGKQKPIITVITNASPSTYKLNLEGYVEAGKSEEETPSVGQ